jgi:hypothetical protein
LEPAGEEFDKYSQHATIIDELRNKGKHLLPCTWLYYASVVNPGGSLSPCCMVTNQDSDFGVLDQKTGPRQVFQDFSLQWRGATYRAARRLFASTRVEAWANKNLNVRTPDGMGLVQVGRQYKLICDACPIPEDIELWSALITSIYATFRRGLAECSFRQEPIVWLRLWVRLALLRIAIAFDAATDARLRARNVPLSADATAANGWL